MAPRSRVHLPRRTVRLRLTALYGGLFLVSGVVLLAIIFGLAAGRPIRTIFVTGQARAGVVKAVPVGLGKRVCTALGLPCQSKAAGFQVPFPDGDLGAVPVPPPVKGNLAFQAVLPTAGELHQLLAESLVALGIMAVLSIALGWVVAGRVLRPLRTMTSTARQISEENLHQRLDVRGPADELKDLGDTIDGLLGRLETAFEAQRRFVANASHELRTPLAMMRTSLDVALGKPQPPPEVRTLAGKLEEGFDQANRLLEGLLLLARAQRGALGEMVEVSLSDLVSDALIADHAEIARLHLTVFDTTVPAEVIGNETLLARMVANVVDNAVRHNLAGGLVHISNVCDGTVERLVVENGGEVLDEVEVQKLAEPFHRLGPERVNNNNNGAGLGLSIVRAIAIAHGGTLELHARPQGGLQVVIELPAAVRI